MKKYNQKRREKREMKRAEAYLDQQVRAFIDKMQFTAGAFDEKTGELAKAMNHSWRRYCHHHGVGFPDAMKASIGLLEAKHYLEWRYGLKTSAELMNEAMKMTDGDIKEACAQIIKHGAYAYVNPPKHLTQVEGMRLVWQEEMEDEIAEKTLIGLWKYQNECRKAKKARLCTD